MRGVPYYWSTLGKDTEPSAALHTLIKKADIVMPWAVGRYNSKTFDPSVVAGDVAWCAANGVDYVPLVFAGFSWGNMRSEEHTSELQSLMRISYAVFCLKKQTNTQLHSFLRTYI